MMRKWKKKKTDRGTSPMEKKKEKEKKITRATHPNRAIHYMKRSYKSSTISLPLGTTY